MRKGVLAGDPSQQQLGGQLADGLQLRIEFGDVVGVVPLAVEGAQDTHVLRHMKPQPLKHLDSAPGATGGVSDWKTLWMCST